MSTKLAQDRDAFLQHLTAEKRLSPHTEKNYRRDITRLLAFCTAQDISDWSALTAAHLRQFVAQCHQQGLGSRSIQRCLSSIRTLFRYLISQDKVSMNPAEMVQAPKAAKRLPSTLDVDQVFSLLAPIDATDWLACRDHAMMELLYSSGLRLAELASLDRQTTDMIAGMVRVMGKGNKMREVPVGSQALAALSQWHTHRDKRAAVGEKALFINQRGTRLGMRSIQKRLQEWGVKQGVSSHVHPHRLRHAFASHMLEASGDLRAVQELLGHSDISSTQIYTHLDFQHLAKVYDAAHPRAKKRGQKKGSVSHAPLKQSNNKEED